jgi:hypothetical protein
MGIGAERVWINAIAFRGPAHAEAELSERKRQGKNE